MNMAATELDTLRRVLGAAEALLGARAIDGISEGDWALLERAVAEATRAPSDDAPASPAEDGIDIGAA